MANLILGISFPQHENLGPTPDVGFANHAYALHGDD